MVTLALFSALLHDEALDHHRGAMREIKWNLRTEAFLMSQRTPAQMSLLRCLSRAERYEIDGNSHLLLKEKLRTFMEICWTFSKAGNLQEIDAASN